MSTVNSTRRADEPRDAGRADVEVAPPRTAASADRARRPAASHSASATTRLPSDQQRPRDRRGEQLALRAAARSTITLSPAKMAAQRDEQPDGADGDERRVVDRRVQPAECGLERRRDDQPRTATGVSSGTAIWRGLPAVSATRRRARAAQRAARSGWAGCAGATGDGCGFGDVVAMACSFVVGGCSGGLGERLAGQPQVDVVERRPARRDRRGERPTCRCSAPIASPATSWSCSGTVSVEPTANASAAGDAAGAAAPPARPGRRRRHAARGSRCPARRAAARACRARRSRRRA